MNTKDMSKRQQRREQIRRKERNSRLWAIGLITGGVLIVAFLFFYSYLKPTGDIVEAPQRDLSALQVDFNKLGNPDAPIKITEFSDFQCPYCRIFFENTEELLIERYVANGTVYFEYKSVGAFIGAESLAAAEAAYCAGDQGKFWEMHDTIFANQGGENVGAFNDRKLSAFAENVGLDMTAYQDCIDSRKYRDLANQDATDANTAGIQATPSFLLTYMVNGEEQLRVVQGAQTIDAFAQEIEAALAEMGQ
ncbi:MAG: thioredoxin domain-containing protein [Anaerolineales bacterium]|nr:thioredoxin domain-containing protein [Anaerolineales bacterium]